MTLPTQMQQVAQLPSVSSKLMVPLYLKMNSNFYLLMVTAMLLCKSKITMAQT
jgi:hypothetical protein